MICSLCSCYFFFFKQKTAYEMRISDWSSDVCSSDLLAHPRIADVRPFAGHDSDRMVRDHRPHILGVRNRSLAPNKPERQREHERRHAQEDKFLVRSLYMPHMKASMTHIIAAPMTNAIQKRVSLQQTWSMLQEFKYISPKITSVLGPILAI